MSALLNALQSGNAETSTKSNDYDVARFINISIGGFDASIRIFKKMPKGLNATQKAMYQLMQETPIEKLEAALKTVPVVITSIKDAGGTVNEDALAQFKSALGL